MSNRPSSTFSRIVRRIGKQRRELAGVGLEARDVALGEIEEALDVLLLARRHLEEIAKGLDLDAPTPRRRRRAILAPSAITPMVKPIWRRPGCAPSSAGGDARPSSEPIGSALASRVTPSTILSQIFIPPRYRFPLTGSRRRSPRRPAGRVQDGGRSARWPAGNSYPPSRPPSTTAGARKRACTPVSQSIRPRDANTANATRSTNTK